MGIAVSPAGRNPAGDDDSSGALNSCVPGVEATDSRGESICAAKGAALQIVHMTRKVVRDEIDKEASANEN